MSDPLLVTDHDVKEPNLLLRFLRKIGPRISGVEERVYQVELRPSGITAQEANYALKATGQYPLNVTGLLGVLAQPQPANVTAYDVAPTAQVLQSLRDGQLVTVGSTTTGDTLYRVVGGNPNSLRALSPSISAGGVVTVLDSNFTIQDNADPTKQAQFQASGISAGTTRVYSFPDATTTLVGTDNTATLTNKTINLTSNTLVATSAQLAAALTDESGSGPALFQTNATIVTPTIASFTNATHNHQNAAGGGSLDVVAISSGTLGNLRGGTGVTGTPIGGGSAVVLGSDWSIYTPSVSASAGTYSGYSVTSARYAISGNTLHVVCQLTGGTLSASPAYIGLDLPEGTGGSDIQRFVAQATNGGVVQSAYVSLPASSGTIRIYTAPMDTGTWTTGASNGFALSIAVEIV